MANCVSRLAARPAALGLLFATTMLAPVARARAPDWVSTATLGVPVAALVGATDQGPLSSSQALTVRVGMTPRNLAALQQLVVAQATPGNPEYEKFLTPSRFRAMFGPSTAQINRVVNYLQTAGFTNITVEPNGLLISADGTAGMAALAFNTALEQVAIGSATQFINTSAAQVPAKLGGVVSAVLGLNNVGMMLPPLALPSLPQYAVSYTPTQFQQIYSVSKVKPATRASIAIMAEGDLTGVFADLRTAEAAFGLPQVPVTLVQVGVASTDTSGADEWDLDTQYSSGMAQDLKMLYVYATTSLSDSDLALEFSHWATDDLAKAASASLGECEGFAYLDGSMAIDDMSFLQAASQGQTFFASAGDTGSFCPIGPAGVNGVPVGAPLVNYPAASPYVVGVGGTTLLTNADGSYDLETAWATGGGGVSQFEGSPYWQQAQVALLAPADLRGVPDIAMDADPESGAEVYVNGAPEGVGGTSLSSPLALGVWARTISINRKLGNAGPLIYSLYDGTGGTGGLTGTYPEGGFHDITVGTNGLYEAGPGYDLTTGLGTFIVDQFAKDLK